MAQGNFLIPNPKGYYLPQKILNKIHAFRGELISRLKKAAKTFAIIDATYQEIIKVEALKCNNQHIFSQFQSRIREMQEALGSMNGKTPYQSLFNDKEVRESMSTFGNQHKDIYSYEAEEILHSSDSEEEIKEQNRKMSKYLNKNIEKVINWLQPNKSLGQRRFTNPPLAKSISETQLRGNNLKIAIKRNMGIASDADLTSGNATPKGEKTDTSTISKYERILYTTTERYTNALDTARIQSFNECLTKARKSFMEFAKNTKEYNKLVNSDIRRIREDINDLTKYSESEAKNELSENHKDPPSSFFGCDSSAYPDTGKTSIYKSFKDDHNLARQKTSAHISIMKQYTNDSLYGIYKDGKPRQKYL